MVNLPSRRFLRTAASPYQVAVSSPHGRLSASSLWEFFASETLRTCTRQEYLSNLANDANGNEFSKCTAQLSCDAAMLPNHPGFAAKAKVPIVSTSPSLLQSASVLFLSFCTCSLGRDGKKFQREFPLSRWRIYETQQVLTLGAGRWKQGLKHGTSPHTLAHPIFNRFGSFYFTFPLLQNRQTLKSRHGFYQKFRKSRRSAKILVMRGSINKGSNASNKAQ